MINPICKGYQVLPENVPAWFKSDTDPSSTSTLSYQNGGNPSGTGPRFQWNFGMTSRWRHSDVEFPPTIQKKFLASTEPVLRKCMFCMGYPIHSYITPTLVWQIAKIFFLIEEVTPKHLKTHETKSQTVFSAHSNLLIFQYMGRDGRYNINPLPPPTWNRAE